MLWDAGRGWMGSDLRSPTVLAPSCASTGGMGGTGQFPSDWPRLSPWSQRHASRGDPGTAQGRPLAAWTQVTQVGLATLRKMITA